MRIKSYWKAGDRVIWHRAGAAVTATIQEVRPDKVGTSAKLKVDGWLGDQWERIPEPIRSGNGALAFALFEPFDPAPDGMKWGAAKSVRSRTWHLSLVRLERDKRNKLVNRVEKFIADYGTGHDDFERLRKSLYYGPNKVARA